jgi:adenylate kinase
VDGVFDQITEAVDRSLRDVQLNVVVLGAPGSGRSTQAKLLANQYNLHYISTTELLHDAAEKPGALGTQIAEAMEQGALVPDEVVIRVIEGYIRTHPGKNGMIFKGFPRTMVQAYIMDGMLRKIGQQVSCILDIQVPTLELFRRLSQRGTTERALQYDKNTDTIVRRIEDHERYSSEISDYYGKTRRLHVIDGVGTPEQVYQRMADRVEDAFRQAR